MQRLPFVPARNSRHRIAVLSLYRALLRSANKIDVPNDVCQTTTKGPLAFAINKAFVKNRPYTSYRLVYASMTAGYKFLSLFSKAQTLGSPEHTELIAHLRSRPNLTRSSTSKSNSQMAKAPSEPFLKNTARPGEPPLYKPTYVPISFKSRIPSVSATADGQPFLRFKKPQPKALSKMIGRKGRIFTKKMLKLLEADEDLTQEAALEDQWDNLVAKQMRNEGVASEGEVAHRDTGKVSASSYAWSVRLSKLWWEWQIEKMWMDWIARGEALNQLVQEQRGQAKRSAKTASIDTGDKKSTRNQSRDKHNIDADSWLPFPLSASITARRRGDLQGSVVDPFTAPTWNALVNAQSSRMMRWSRKPGAN